MSASYLRDSAQRIRVNRQWRLVFQWDGSRDQASEVYLETIATDEANHADAAGPSEVMGVQRKHVNELCNNRRNVTAATALILARVFGNSPEFWLNVQRRTDLWEAMNSPHACGG